MRRKFLERCPTCNSPKPKFEPCPHCAEQSRKAGPSANSPVALAKDQCLGPYKIERLIAKGAMGRIYRAMHNTLFKPVALKVLSPERIFDDPNIFERFIQEAQLTAKLKHPNIATVYDAGQHQGIYYIAMDLIEGRALTEILAEKNLTIKQTLSIVAQIAGALQYAHGHQIIHRDVKPGNIMLDNHGTPFIMDFGLAKDTRLDLKLTRAGIILGSPHYLSPEQTCSEKIDHRSDIFSLGVVFYEMLTFERPFGGKSLPLLVQQIVSSTPTPIREIAPHVHQDIQTICMKCMEKLPSSRYQNASDLARDIDSFLRGEAIQARPTSPVYRVRKWVRRNRPVALAFGLVLCCLAAATISLCWISQWGKQARIEQKQVEMRSHLQFICRQIAGEIENAWLYAISDGRVLAKMNEIKAMMTGEPQQSAYRNAHRTLSLWVETKGYLAIYLLDRKGFCMLSTDLAFEGHTYDFRPYYSEAVQGRENIFYALGTTNGEPGYYCAVPCYRESEIVGICVIKFDPRPISRILARASIFRTEKVFLSDADGILIQSNHSDAPLLHLCPIDEKRRERIRSSRQFLEESLRPLGLRLESPLALREPQIRMVRSEDDRRHLLLLAPLASFPYTVVLVVEYEELMRISENLTP